MSSLVERLRVRSDKRPLYNLDLSDDDDFIVSRNSKGKQPADKSKQGDESNPAEKSEPAVRIVREDAKEDACHVCEEGEDLVSCSSCTYRYHKKCLYPVSRKAISETWNCPECESPLLQIEKILDHEARPAPTAAEEAGSSKPSPKKAYVKYYLVKWKGLSYLHCTWVPEKEFLKSSRVYPRVKSRLNNYHKQMNYNINSEDEQAAIRTEWTTVDRIIGSRKIGEEREYFVKWRDLTYDESTWELEADISAFKPQIERYNLIQSRGSEKTIKAKNMKYELKELKHKQKEFRHNDQSPEFLTGGKLHPYQLEGLNFLRYSWSKNTHVILADEMGLGKTIQSIAFLASLYEEEVYPHLVVAPLSTLRNWEREFAMWAPHMNVVTYAGSLQARDIIKQYEFYFPKQKNKLKKKKSLQGDKQKKQRKIKFDVLLTTYEMINLDNALRQIQWECMIVDEGHRLKNKDSKLFNQLKLYSTKHRVLLTGTPLQNNLDELFMLMHFLDAGKFASIEDFQKEFTDINQEEQIARLHKMLAPHLLRRVKKDVMKDLPPKKELILRVELSPMQKEYYKAILTRNYQLLARRGGAQISLINVVMELRKLCCHAYMLEGVEPDKELTNAEGFRQFLDASGKLQLLDKMMVKLKEQGHRVLIYSQFQHMLDLLEDYLSCKKWAYERIDGKVSGAERQIRIDRFNAKSSTRFCFLLSTRAGGLGINLATADTVIIYDSDWNPHADLQAMARAHRLGQTSKVMIYRLITRGTIEERMMQMTKKKMILEHLVVGRLKAQTVNQEELDDIIRYGSKELFADENDEAKARQIHYDDAAIDRLLNRDQADGEEASVSEEDDNFLKAFKVANFEYIEEVEAATALEEELKHQSSSSRASSSNAERANYWDELLRDKYEVQQIEEFTLMGKGKRSRRQMVATGEDNVDISSEDEDYSCEEELSESEPSVVGNPSSRRGQFSKKRMHDYSEPHPLMEGEGRSLKVLGFNQNQRSLFQQLIMRYGYLDYTFTQFAPKFKGKTLEEVFKYGKLFIQHLCEDANDSPTFSDGVPKEGARADDIITRAGHIRLIEKKVKFMSSNPGAPMFHEVIHILFPGLNGRFWKSEQDLILLKAILKHGYARWQCIIEDVSTGIADYARKESNIPNVSFPETVQTNEATSSANANGTAEMGQYRELQRRLVEFIRKRYYLLEKALHKDIAVDQILAKYEAEDASKDYQTNQNAANNDAASKDYETDQDTGNNGAASQDHRTDQRASQKNNPDMLKVEQLLKQLPDLEHIPIDGMPYSNKDERLKMAFLYNELCKVVETNGLDSVQAYLGDTSASCRLLMKLNQLETIKDDICRIIAEIGQSKVVEGPNSNVIGDISLARQIPVKMDHSPSSGVGVKIGNKRKNQSPKDQSQEKVICLG